VDTKEVEAEAKVEAAEAAEEAEEAEEEGDEEDAVVSATVSVRVVITLQSAWIAGMLGMHTTTITVNKKLCGVWAFLGPNNEPVAVFAARRGLQTSVMPPKEHAEACEAYRVHLRAGTRLSCPDIPALHGANVQLATPTSVASADKTAGYIIPVDSSPVEVLFVAGVPWEVMRHNIEVVVPMHNPLPCTLDTAVQLGLAPRRPGTRRSGRPPAYTRPLSEVRAVVHARLLAMPPMARARMRALMSGCQANVNFPAIGRDGGGTDEALSTSDGHVYRALLLWSTVIPGALVRAGPCRFFTTSRVLLWKLAEMVEQEGAVIDKATNLDGTTTGVLGHAPSHTSPWLTCFKDTQGRTARHYQDVALAAMCRKKISFLYASVGSGKSYIVIRHMMSLLARGELPALVVVAVPRSARVAVNKELHYFFPPSRVVTLWPVASANHRPVAPERMVRTVAALPVSTVVLVEHDHLRCVVPGTGGSCVADLLAAQRPYVWIDEVHKAFAKTTTRTRLCRTLTAAAAYATVTTGTPVLGPDTMALAGPIQPCTPFAITRANIVIAMSLLNAHVVNTGKKVYDTMVMVDTVAQLPAYVALAPPSLGGTNKEFNSAKNMPALFKLSWDAEETVLVAQALTYMADGVFLVARDRAHQSRLVRRMRDAVAKAGGEASTRGTVECMDGSMDRESRKAWHCVVGRMRLSEGFSMCFAGTLVWGVALTNHATREQMRGRIDRITQTRPSVRYITVCSRFTELVHNKHLSASGIAAVMRALANEI
jgi:hypothetical protein